MCVNNYLPSIANIGFLQVFLHIRLARDDLLFEVGCEYLDADMLSSCEEESGTDRSIQEDIFLLFCELEYVLQDIDRCRRLLEKELYRRVRHYGFPILVCHEVFYILCDRRDTESILAGSLHEAEEESRRVLILHDIPRFIHDELSPLHTRSRDIPDVVQDDIHSDRT